MCLCLWVEMLTFYPECLISVKCNKRINADEQCKRSWHKDLMSLNTHILNGILSRYSFVFFHSHLNGSRKVSFGFWFKWINPVNHRLYYKVLPQIAYYFELFVGGCCSSKSQGGSREIINNPREGLAFSLS